MTKKTRKNDDVHYIIYTRVNKTGTVLYYELHALGYAAFTKRSD